MIKENDAQTAFPPHSCYKMLNTAFSGSKSVTGDLKKLDGGMYSYTVYVSDEAKASVVGCLMNSSFAKGRVKVKSFMYDENSADGDGFCISVEEKIY